MKSTPIQCSAILHAVTSQSDMYRKQRDDLLVALQNAVMVSESLATDYEYCAEWRDAMRVMRAAITKVEADTELT